MPFLLALLLSVSLSPPFGEAAAELIGFTPSEVTIEISVDVLDSAALVLLRGEDVSGQELDPVALLARDDGTWGAVVVLPARRDLRLAFEFIPPAGASTLSVASSLAELGIDPGLLSVADPPPIPDEDPSPPVGLGWVITAAVAALAALVLLAVWSRSGGKDEPAAAELADEHAGYDGVAVDGG